MIEYFYFKRDISFNKNWVLDWNNLFGCCIGGIEFNKIIFFSLENLSCDKYKEIVLFKINNVEGYFINLIDMLVFFCLFKIN